MTVALSGDGGDETFGGYRRYRFHLMEEKLRSTFPLGVRRPVFGALGRAYPKADWAPRVLRAKSTFEALGRDSVEAYFHTMSIVRSPLRQQLYSSSFKRELAGYDAIDVMRRHAARAPTDDPLSQIQYLDMKTYLVGDINTKVDRAAMAHSLEVREPLMDHPLVEWMGTLPSSLKIRAGEQKFLLKKAMEPFLPNEIMYRPKMGFAVPLAQWFRGPLASRVQSALLRAPAVRYRLVRPRRPEAHRRPASVRRPRPQHADLDDPDVRRLPQERRGGDRWRSRAGQREALRRIRPGDEGGLTRSRRHGRGPRTTMRTSIARHSCLRGRPPVPPDGRSPRSRLA